MTQTTCPHCKGSTWRRSTFPHCLISYPQIAPVGHAIAVDAYLCNGCGEIRLVRPSDARRASVEGYWSQMKRREAPRNSGGLEVPRTAEQAMARRVLGVEFRRGSRQLRLRLDDGAYQGFDHREAASKFDGRYYRLLLAAIEKHEGRLVELANMYQRENRDFHSFLYDLVALVYFASKLPSDFRRLLEKNELKSEGDLLHNRVLAQLAGHFQRDYSIVLNPRSNRGPTPDITVGRLGVEVKTIVGRYYWRADSVCRLVRKIREKRDSGMRQTDNGAVFISFWSIYMNNLFRDSFWGQYSDAPHPPQGGGTYFVLDGHRAFEDYYTSGGVYPQIGGLPSSGLLRQSPLASPSPHGTFAMTRAGFPASVWAPPGKCHVSFSMG